MLRLRVLPGKSGCLFRPFRSFDPEADLADGKSAPTEDSEMAVALRLPVEEFFLAEYPLLLYVEAWISLVTGTAVGQRVKRFEWRDNSHGGGWTAAGLLGVWRTSLATTS